MEKSDAREKADGIRRDAGLVYQDMVRKWGIFRRWIARNPLTGFWSGVGGGVLAGAFAVTLINALA